jgi:hypothetical protein
MSRIASSEISTWPGLIYLVREPQNLDAVRQHARDLLHARGEVDGLSSRAARASSWLCACSRNCSASGSCTSSPPLIGSVSCSSYGRHARFVDPQAFAAHLELLRNTKWVVYCKRPFGGPNEVLRYLARYTHRVAISNRRLLACDEKASPSSGRTTGSRFRALALFGRRQPSAWLALVAGARKPAQFADSCTATNVVRLLGSLSPCDHGPYEVLAVRDAPR